MFGGVCLVVWLFGGGRFVWCGVFFFVCLVVVMVDSVCWCDCFGVYLCLFVLLLFLVVVGVFVDDSGSGVCLVV